MPGESKMSARGVFVTFEGGEGCGKSTQLGILVDELASAGLDVLLVREPGSTTIGESIREMLLDPANCSMDSGTELLLYEASRAQHVAEVIRPALAAGRLVLCDRFADSSTAYQGYGRGLSLERVASLNESATDGLVPDLTIVLDIDPTEGLARATSTYTDRLEAEDAEFHKRVAEGYRSIAKSEPDRVILVDAVGSKEDVAGRIMEALRRLPVIVAAMDGDTAR